MWQKRVPWVTTNHAGGAMGRGGAAGGAGGEGGKGGGEGGEGGCGGVGGGADGGFAPQRMRARARATCSSRLPPQAYSKRKCSVSRVRLAVRQVPSLALSFRLQTAEPTASTSCSDAPSAPRGTRTLASSEQTPRAHARRPRERVWCDAVFACVGGHQRRAARGQHSMCARAGAGAYKRGTRR
ncbi:MAG: hypothetical protein CMJ19_16280 [Phycisphaeraceae bacterium]|nr:hypothetical protein [Phycisphaeraceae bacterium]